MTHLEAEIQQLKDAVNGMVNLVKSQLEKSKEAFLTHNVNLAQEVISFEKRVNATELSIDRDCENIFALFNPVAIDLRFVLAMLKINSHLERIGDHAEGVAKYVIQSEFPIDKKIIKELRLDEMFDLAISMLDDACYSVVNEDTSSVRLVFDKDATMNEINGESPEIIYKYSRKSPDKIQQYLYLFSTIKKLERVGDLAKNVAEESIFYIEAKVLKHNKAERHKQ